MRLNNDYSCRSHGTHLMHMRALKSENESEDINMKSQQSASVIRHHSLVIICNKNNYFQQIAYLCLQALISPYLQFLHTRLPHTLSLSLHSRHEYSPGVVTVHRIGFPFVGCEKRRVRH
mgnify:CR=1 FL=1